MVDLPEDFEQWPASAKRVYVSESLTQREQLRLAAEAMELDVEIGATGSLTNRDLGRFIAELVCAEVGG